MAATNEQVVSFIQLLGGLALKECNNRAKAGAGYVVPSIVIAQSAQETGWGLSDLMTKANAFFGIKAGGSWTGKVFTADTWEVVDGVEQNTVANFRAYDSLEDSVADYFNLIVNNSRYANGVSTWGNQLSAYDTIHAIWSGGYATDSNYVADIMNIVNGRDLTQWDSRVDPEDATGDYTYTPPSGGSGGSSGGSIPVGDIEPMKFIFEKV